MYDQFIYDEAIKQGFTPTAAKLVVAQARFESSDYTSGVFQKNNNMYGMKYVGQPLATKGSLAPSNERSCPTGCKNSDFYAKYASPADSAKDVMTRLYMKTMGGVTPADLRNATDTDDFALKLKKRSYYGFMKTPETWGSEVRNYANGLKAKLLKINIIEIVKKNKGKFTLGLALLISGLVWYFYNKKK
jgi:hypothetical protein